MPTHEEILQAYQKGAEHARKGVGSHTSRGTHICPYDPEDAPEQFKAWCAGYDHQTRKRIG